MKSISVAWLTRQKACPDQVELFRATFGEKAKITRQNLARAAETRLNVGWLAGRLLTEVQWVEYKSATVAAWRASDERNRAALAPWAECRRAMLSVEADALANALNLPSPGSEKEVL